MALSAPPVTVAALDEGYLNAGIAAGDVTITVAPIYKTVAGVLTKQGFDTTSGICLIRLGSTVERISYTTLAVDATTKITTLTGVTRGMSLNATTPSYAGGTGVAFPKGAKISVVHDVSYAQDILTSSGTQTLSNKRITKRVGTTASSATPTINTDNVDMYIITAQTVDITSFTTNLSGTPNNGDTLIISVTGTASRALTFGSSFEASTVALPTTTTGTARLDMGFIWNSSTSKWRILASS